MKEEDGEDREAANAVEGWNMVASQGWRGRRSWTRIRSDGWR
jgi:hypothetical protein